MSKHNKWIQLPKKELLAEYGTFPDLTSNPKNLRPQKL
jgi:hypothetical protein